MSHLLNLLCVNHLTNIEFFGQLSPMLTVADIFGVGVTPVALEKSFEKKQAKRIPQIELAFEF